MLELIRKLARDTVGSSISTEMSLVTSVTVGALVMGMGNFTAGVKHRFDVVSETPALSMAQADKQSKLEEKQRQDERARRLEEAKRAAAEKLKAAAERNQ